MSEADLSAARRALAGFSRWIDAVAAGVSKGLEALREERAVLLTEQDKGVFACRVLPSAASSPPEAPIPIAEGAAEPAVAARLAEKCRGARVELLLRSDRFLFRPLELPSRASDFLEGIVRAQIDRLTPWSVADAAFGFRPSGEATGERMVVTVAATARALIAPLVETIASLGARTIIVFAPSPDDQPGAPIKVFERNMGEVLEVGRIRRILVGLLLGAGGLAALSLAADFVVGGTLQSSREEMMGRIAIHRARVQPGRDGAGAAALDLERRKRETPSIVIVYEDLSRILPDDTYVTELRLVGDKMQMAGVTGDAPTLIRLIEKSSRFTEATFFAPTTRSPGEANEHFYIEAHVEPQFDAGARPDPAMAK